MRKRLPEEREGPLQLLLQFRKAEKFLQQNRKSLRLLLLLSHLQLLLLRQPMTDLPRMWLPRCREKSCGC